MTSSITQCRICGNRHLETILQLGVQKLTGVFPDRPNAPLIEGPLDLVRCVPSATDCGLLQLRHSYPSEAMYGDNYGYRSGLNKSMELHLARKAAFLHRFSEIENGELAVDIGSNDGTLLKSYPAEIERAGIDPVAKKFLHFYPPEIRVYTDFFSRELWQQVFGERQARIITSVAMFYDVEHPLEFMRAIRECLAPEGLWHFEQSYMPLMLEHCAYDTICHEHVEYYALRQIHWMAERSGLKIVDLQTSNINGGSLAVTAARKESRYAPAEKSLETLLEQEREAGFEGMEPFEKFRAAVFRHRTSLQEQIARLHQEEQKVLGYGASTKGNVLLQFCDFSVRDLPYIAEVNPEKYGRFTPGTDIPIISEAEMHLMRPDVLLVLPWHFRENLIAREATFLERGGRFLFPLPRVEYYER